MNNIINKIDLRFSSIRSAVYRDLNDIKELLELSEGMLRRQCAQLKSKLDDESQKMSKEEKEFSPMADHLKFCGLYIDLFRDFFSDLFKAGSATADFFAFIDIMDHIDLINDNIIRLLAAIFLCVSTKLF